MIRRPCRSSWTLLPRSPGRAPGARRGLGRRGRPWRDTLDQGRRHVRQAPRPQSQTGRNPLRPGERGPLGMAADHEKGGRRPDGPPVHHRAAGGPRRLPRARSRSWGTPHPRNALRPDGGHGDWSPNERIVDLPAAGFRCSGKVLVAVAAESRRPGLHPKPHWPARHPLNPDYARGADFGGDTGATVWYKRSAHNVLATTETPA